MGTQPALRAYHILEFQIKDLIHVQGIMELFFNL
jgi:hypothetical protein